MSELVKWRWMSSHLRGHLNFQTSQEHSLKNIWGPVLFVSKKTLLTLFNEKNVWWGLGHTTFRYISSTYVKATEQDHWHIHHLKSLIVDSSLLFRNNRRFKARDIWIFALVSIGTSEWPDYEVICPSIQDSNTRLCSTTCIVKMMKLIWFL